MPNLCNSCGRIVEGRKSEHICDTMQLSDGRIVQADRVMDPDGDVRKQIEDGEVKVEYRNIKKPIRAISDKFSLTKGEPNQ